MRHDRGLARIATVALGAAVAALASAAPRVVAPEEPPAARDTGEIVAELDRLLAEAWAAQGLTPNAPCTDEEFVRRVHLDVVGMPPTAAQAEEFLAERSPGKRERLVETLLASPGYARHFANQWAEVLVGIGTGKNQFDFVPSAFMPWLEGRIASGRPWGGVITDIVTAGGTPYTNGAVNYSSRVNFTPDDLAAVSSKAFLGVQIQCAQCHDHPYDAITRDDFAAFAAFWGRVRVRRVDIPYGTFGSRAVDMQARARAERIEKDVAEIMKNGASEAQARTEAERRRQRTKEIGDFPGDVGLPLPLAEGRAKDLGEVVRRTPRFLKAGAYQDRAGETRRAALAKWMADPANPYTSRALANRMWGWFLGRGFVHPVDDFSNRNVPAVPAALDALAADTTAHGMDLRRLVRVITATRAYRTTTASRTRTPDAVEHFATGPLKPLTLQQSYDALNLTLGVVADGRALTISAGPVAAIEREEGRPGFRAMMDALGPDEESGEKDGLDAARAFFRTFADDGGGDDVDAHGGGAAFDCSVQQGLLLMNGAALNRALDDPAVSSLPRLLGEHASDRERIRHLFLRALAREPRSGETDRLVAYVRARPQEVGASFAPYADVLWALISSSEFGSNH